MLRPWLRRKRPHKITMSSDPPSAFIITPISEAQAREMLSWTYEPPYDIYNPDPKRFEEDLRYFLDPAMQMYAVTRQTGETWEMVGGCSFGADARVPGADYSQPALDLGIGLRPDVVGHGVGPRVIEAMMAFAQQRWGKTHFRATIAEFNTRSQGAFTRAGFHITQRFLAEFNKRPFVVMEKQSGPAA